MLACALTQYSLVSRLEVVLSDHFRFSERTAPGGGTVLVVVDEATVRKLGKYPFDRAVLGRTLDVLNEAGANRIYLDGSLNVPEDPASDDALEAALRRLGKDRVALPVWRIGNSEGAVVLMQPLPNFSQHSSLVTTAVIFDSDGRARRLTGLPAEGYGLSVDWLHGSVPPLRSEPLFVDYSIDPAGLRRFGMLDVVEGRVDASAFAGRNVIVGLQLSTPQFMIASPVYRQLNRIDLIAIAVETLHSERRFSKPSAAAAFLLTLTIALAFTALVVRLNSFVGLLALGCLVVIWLSVVDQMQRATGLLPPVLPPLLAMLILWQGLKFKDSRLGRLISRQHTRLVGVGKSALVAAVDVVADPAAVFDAAGVILGANDAFRALGLTTVAGGKAHDLRSLFSDAAIALTDSARNGAQSRIEFSMTSAHGARHFEASIRWVDTLTEKLAIAGFKDVTHVRQRETELSALAFRDPLTGLANRAAFSAHLRLMGEAAGQRPFGLLVIDLDGFKQVNDTFGHHAGDLVLAGVASRIERLLRADDAAARLGGDEYAILVASGDMPTCVQIANRLLTALAEPFLIEGCQARVGASIGIALCPEHSADAATALKLADAAMYVAKRNKPAYAVHSDSEVVAIKSRAA